jgi:hypothetical protein
MDLISTQRAGGHGSRPPDRLRPARDDAA